MNKTLQKTVMTRSRLRNKFFKNKTHSNETAYKKQITVSVFFERKKSFCENLGTKNNSDINFFWKTVNPFLANKSSSNRNKVTLTQKDETISRSKDVAEVFNTFFVNVVSSLGIVISESLFGNTGETNDPIVNIIESYKTYLCRQHATQLDNRFSFEQITYEDIHKAIKKKLDCTKASQDIDIPSSVIKENADIFANFLYFSYNKAVPDCEFPKSFKNANVLPIYTKYSRLEEKTIAPLAFSIVY